MHARDRSAGARHAVRNPCYTPRKRGLPEVQRQAHCLHALQGLVPPCSACLSVEPLRRQGQALRALRGLDGIAAGAGLPSLAASRRRLKKMLLASTCPIGQTRVYAKIDQTRGEPSSFPPRKPAPRLRKSAVLTLDSRQGGSTCKVIRLASTAGQTCTAMSMGILSPK